MRKLRLFYFTFFLSLLTLLGVLSLFLYPGNSLSILIMVVPLLLSFYLKNTWFTRISGGLAILALSISMIFPRNDLGNGLLLNEHLVEILFVALLLFIQNIKNQLISLESEGNQMNSLFEHATEGIILTNHEGRIILANPASLQLFNYSLGEILGKSIDSLIPSRYLTKHQQYRSDFYHTPSNRTMGHGRDLFAQTRDGKEFPVEVSLSYYHQKKDLYVIAFIVDITPRKEAEKNLLFQKKQLEDITADMRRLNAELENKVEQRTSILREALGELEKSQKGLHEALKKEKELNEIKSRFVSMASHEFRTPLSTVLSSAALLSRYTLTADQEKRNKHIQRIKEAVKQLNDLLEDFLSVGKLEEGKIYLDLIAVDLPSFLTELQEEMDFLLQEGQHLELTYSGEGTFITDKRILRNMLINLLTNAIKFSPSPARIWLTIQNREDGLTILVRDEGIGIAEEDQQHLFTSFFRGKNVTNIEGTGLGLNIVKRYVELCQGSITCQSQLDSGTSFTIHLPVYQRKME
ncbi:MAG: ATP-binding protein [Chitinophagaceae bacterium]